MAIVTFCSLPRFSHIFLKILFPWRNLQIKINSEWNLKKFKNLYFNLNMTFKIIVTHSNMQKIKIFMDMAKLEIFIQCWWHLKREKEDHVIMLLTKLLLRATLIFFFALIFYFIGWQSLKKVILLLYFRSSISATVYLLNSMKFKYHRAYKWAK